MNRVSAIFALFALTVGSVVGAQTSPSPQNRTQEPSSTVPMPSTSQPMPSPETNTGPAKRAMLKNCIAQQRSQDPKTSQADARKICADRMKSSTHESSTQESSTQENSTHD